MAATWDVTITVSNLSSKLVTVTGVRTDGVDVRTYTLQGVSADTHDIPLATIRASVVAALRNQYLAAVAAEAKVAALLSGWAAVLESDLNALET